MKKMTKEVSADAVSKMFRPDGNKPNQNTPCMVDELDRIPDSKNQLGPTIAYVCTECGYIEFYRDMTSVN